MRVVVVGIDNRDIWFSHGMFPCEGRTLPVNVEDKPMATARVVRLDIPAAQGMGKGPDLDAVVKLVAAVRLTG